MPPIAPPLAAILDALGRAKGGRKPPAKIAGGVRNIYGPDDHEVAVTLNNLAAIQQRRAEQAEAEALYGRAAATKERTFGRDHPELATTLNNLATVLRAQNRLAEAQALYRRCLAIWETSVGLNDPSTVTSRRNYAKLLRPKRQELEHRQLESQPWPAPRPG